MQIAEKCIDLRSDSDTSTSTDQIVDRRAVAVGDFFPRHFVAPIILFRQPGTIEKLVGHALKSRKHYDDPFPPSFLKNDPGDVANPIGCGKRRATKLKDFHSPAKVCSTTPRQTQTSTQLSSIPQPRLAAFAPGCQGYPMIRWADAADLSAVANCIRYRDTIVRGRVPFL